MRSALDALLLEKIERPWLDVWQLGGDTIRTVLELLSSEELVSASARGSK